MPGKLLVVGTPIGNMNDLSPRGAQALAECDFIAAEDTRVTMKILNRLGIKKPMISYYEHNKFTRGGEIISRLIDGETCALVTDAGMPAISDPGEDLVRDCRESGIEVESVPGPTAFATALAISGMPSGRFTFEGFLSVNKPGRREHLASLKGEKRTMIFYEAPHKLPATLRDMSEAFGDRRVAIVRELTKIHEEVIRTTLFDAAQRFADGSLKGEMVIIIEGAPENPAEDAQTLDDAVADAKNYISGGMSKSDAAKTAARDTGFKKGDIYKILLGGESRTGTE